MYIYIYNIYTKNSDDKSDKNSNKNSDSKSGNSYSEFGVDDKDKNSIELVVPSRSYQCIGMLRFRLLPRRRRYETTTTRRRDDSITRYTRY